MSGRLVGLVSAAQMWSDCPPSKYISCAVAETIIRTIPRWYISQFMRLNRLGSGDSGPLITISFDCDMEDDVRAYTSLAATLERHRTKASLAVIGKWIERYPEKDSNPNVHKPVHSILSGIENVLLIEPLDYEYFVQLMKRSYLILTDSGGLQEEAPSLGKPVLVLREVTERPEAVEAGTAQIVGTQPARIIERTIKLLEDRPEYERMSKAINPYGDGKAAEKIVNILAKHSGGNKN